MIALTAFTANQRPMVKLHQQFCERCGVDSVAVPIGHDYPKHSSWFRVRALLDHLPNHDSVLWLDSDACMLRKPTPELFATEAIAFFAKDDNGINNGVALWRNHPKARELLWRMYDAHPRFAQHDWHEQGALHTLAEQYALGFLPKHLFNASEADETGETYVLHLANRTDEYRIKIMKERLC